MIARHVSVSLQRAEFGPVDSTPVSDAEPAATTTASLSSEPG